MFKNESFDVFSKNLRKNVLSTKCDGSFLNDRIIERNTDYLSEYFTRRNISKDPQGISNQSLHHGTELFLFLNMCPCSKNSKKKYWRTFYEYLFSDYLTSQQKVLSLLKILKDKTSKDGQDIANTIMAKLSTELGFRYYLPKVSKKGIIGEEINWKHSISRITGALSEFTAWST